MESVTAHIAKKISRTNTLIEIGQKPLLNEFRGLTSYSSSQNMIEDRHSLARTCSYEVEEGVISHPVLLCQKIWLRQ